VTNPPDSLQSRSGIAPGFLRRLSYYVIGITIGLVMLGLIQRAKHRATASGAGQDNSATTPESATRPPDEQPDEAGG